MKSECEEVSAGRVVLGLESSMPIYVCSWHVQVRKHEGPLRLFARLLTEGMPSVPPPFSYLACWPPVSASPTLLSHPETRRRVYRRSRVGQEHPRKQRAACQTATGTVTVMVMDTNIPLQSRERSRIE